MCNKSLKVFCRNSFQVYFTRYQNHAIVIEIPKYNLKNKIQSDFIFFLIYIEIAGVRIFQK